MSDNEPEKPSVTQAAQVLDNCINVELERQSRIVTKCLADLKKAALDIQTGDFISDKQMLDAFGATTLLEQAAANFSAKATEVTQALKLIRQARRREEEELAGILSTVGRALEKIRRENSGL
jgi:hypothetical protein